LPSAATWRSSRCSGRRGVRLSELAGILYDPEDAQRSDVDLWQREITVRGKGGKARIVRISHQTAVTLDRYIRVRARHAQAYRPQLWLGVDNRGPMTANGIYQMIMRRATGAGWLCTRTGSVIISATPGWTGAVPRGT
jgi:integrase